MTKGHPPDWITSESLEPLRGVKRPSYTRVAITDALLGFGAVTGLCGLAGLADDAGDSLLLLVVSAVSVGIGVFGLRTFERIRRPPTSKILVGLVMTWTTLVLMGVGVYLATGTIDTVDEALLESAAGFSTTALTVVDPTELSVSMQLWRAATQWFGGLFGLLIGVIALPQALRGTSLIGRVIATEESRLVRKPKLARQRIIAVYLGFTAVLGVSYAAVGMGSVNSIVHAFTTASTGGFSSHPDSFVGFGGGARIVATVGMIVAGSSFFVMWWSIRGQVRPLMRSSELRIYVAVIAATTAVIVLDSDYMSVGDSLFTASSTISTTGFAVTDWTVLPDFTLAVLLIAVAMGSMAGSAGGGLRVLRVHTLIKSMLRELRQQLDPNIVIVIKNSRRAVEEVSIERISGYHAAHLAASGVGAFVLASSGLGMVESVWTAVGALSSFGPSVGTGPFGQLDQLSPWARLALVPAMLAARLSVLVVLLGVVWIGGLKRSVLVVVRRRLSVARR